MLLSDQTEYLFKVMSDTDNDDLTRVMAIIARKLDSIEFFLTQIEPGDGYDRGYLAQSVQALNKIAEGNKQRKTRQP